ncbi:MAG: hypothetical protein P4L92_00750 [Rudaea sp.]|nr:hypothetical protein [Rudaea sp.]
MQDTARVRETQRVRGADRNAQETADRDHPVGRWLNQRAAVVFVHEHRPPRQPHERDRPHGPCRLELVGQCEFLLQAPQYRVRGQIGRHRDQPRPRAFLPPRAIAHDVSVDQ